MGVIQTNWPVITDFLRQLRKKPLNTAAFMESNRRTDGRRNDRHFKSHISGKALLGRWQLKGQQLKLKPGGAGYAVIHLRITSR